VQDLLALYKAMGCNTNLKIHFLESTWIFSQKILAKSVTNIVKDFTKTLWLWKSGTKASGFQVCWQTLDTEEGCTWCQILVKVLHLNILEDCFCLFYEHIKYYFAYLNSSVSLKPCLIEKFCINIWIQHKKVPLSSRIEAHEVPLSSRIEACGTKKVKFCWPVESIV